MRNYYRILEIEPDADAAAIEAAYQRLARRYHPDANPSREARGRLKRINEAYEVLRNPASRSKYDARRRRDAGELEAEAARAATREDAPPPSAPRSIGREQIAAIAGIVGVLLIAGLAVGAVVLSQRGDDGTPALSDNLDAGGATSVPLDTTPAAQPTPPSTEGLEITDIEEGTGAVAEPGDELSVHYTGYLDDGTVFDSSVERGEPFTFTLGEGDVIAGWDLGIEGMKVGGKRRLVIPPELAYGNADRGSIPPNSTLTFEVELLEVR
jgi:hypothetical protein